jgi:hypothetical protein
VDLTIFYQTSSPWKLNIAIMPPEMNPLEGAIAFSQISENSKFYPSMSLFKRKIRRNIS